MSVKIRSFSISINPANEMENNQVLLHSIIKQNSQILIFKSLCNQKKNPKYNYFFWTHLIPLDFQLTFLIKLCIPEANAAKLKIAGKDLFILHCELTLAAELVNYLCHPNHVTAAVLDGHAQEGPRFVSRQRVNLAVEPRVLQH